MGWEQSGAGRTLGVIRGHCARLHNESTGQSNFPANPKKKFSYLKDPKFQMLTFLL